MAEKRIVRAGDPGAHEFVALDPRGNEVPNVVSFNLEDGSYEKLDLVSYRASPPQSDMDEFVQSFHPDGTWLYHFHTRERYNG